MKTRKAALSAVLIGASFGLAQLAQAADATAMDSSGPVETVTVTGFLGQGAVTASKLDIPVRDIPLSVSSYTGDFMKAIESTNVSDLYQYMTGVERAGNTGYDMVIRGFKTGGNDRNAIMTDGLPGLTVRFGSPPTIGVDHIEVVKGASSILYGQEQPGGFVNIITKKPEAIQSGTVKLTTTAEQARSGQAWGVDAAADFTGPIDSEGRFLYRIVGEIGDVDHFRDFSYERPVYLAPSFTWNIDDNTTALVQFEYRHTQTSYDSYLVTPDLDITKIPSIYTHYQQPTDWQKETGKTATVTLSHSFAHGITWSGHYRYVDHEDSARGFDVVKIWPGTTTLGRRARGQLNKRTYSFGDTYVTVPFDSWFFSNKLVVGAQYGEETDDFGRLQFYNAPQAPNPLTADIDIYNPVYSTTLPLSSYPIGSINDRITTSDELGVYANDLMTFSDQWKAMVGLRYAKQDQSRLTKVPGKADKLEKNSNSDWLPMAGLIYQPSKTLSFYASYSTSFVPQSASAQDINGNNNFAPVQASAYEVGSKSTFWDGKASVTLALFRIKEKNVLNKFSCPIGTCYEPIGSERSQGLEVELNARPLEGWQILAGYAYTDAKVTDSNTINQIGALLANVPKHDAHIWSRYDFASGPLFGFGFGVGVTYISDRKGTLPTSKSLKVLDLPGYAKADVALYYTYDERYDVTFKVSNIFNKTYYASAGSQGALNILPGTPRTFTLAIRAHI